MWIDAKYDSDNFLLLVAADESPLAGAIVWFPTTSGAMSSFVRFMRTAPLGIGIDIESFTSSGLIVQSGFFGSLDGCQRT